MAGIRHREATTNDIAALAKLIQDLGYSMTMEDLQQNLNDLSTQSLDKVFVAEVDGRLYGMIALHIMRMFHQRENIGRITAMVVAKGYRNQGVGTSLMTYSENYFRSQGCNRIEVVSSEKRELAHHFYIKNHYTTYTGKRFVKLLT